MSLQAVAEEQIVMPFPDYEMVDSERAMRILGVSQTTLYRLLRSGFFSRVHFVRRGPFRIHYWSLVEYCDKLRERYAIPDRRPPLAHSAARYPDDQVLPFPMADVIDVLKVMHILDASKRGVHAKLEAGLIESYKLADNYDWRISQKSLRAYIARSSHVGRSPARFYP